ncbi:hypothetical protein Tco_0439832 [Tanacetum coccineum]
MGNSNDHFNVKSNVIESVLNRDNVISSPKIDFLLDEFAGELAFIAPIPPGIVKADFDPKGYIRFIENLMYDNSFSRPPKTLKDDSETIINYNNDYSSMITFSLHGDIDYFDEFRVPILSSLSLDVSPLDLFKYVDRVKLSDLKQALHGWIARIFEASHAHGFVFRSLGLHSLSFNMGIQYPNLID